MLVIQDDVHIRVRGPDKFVIAGPSGAVVGDSASVHLLSYFNKPVSASQVIEELRQEFDGEELEAAIGRLESKGILGAPQTFPANVEMFPEGSRCTLAEGFDLLKGESKVGLLKTATQELHVFGGMHALVVEAVTPAGSPPIGMEEILEQLQHAKENLTPLRVRTVLADLAEQGVLCLTGSPK